jgi:hypothetical protein
MSEPASEGLQLARLIGEALDGRLVVEAPTSQELAAWIGLLLERYDCAAPLTLEPAPFRGFLAQGASAQSAGPRPFDRFALRFALKMAEITYRHARSPLPPIDQALLSRFRTLIGERPAAILQFHQLQCDVESSLRRALKIRETIGPGLHSVLFVGDDDATSIALALMEPTYRFRVIDIDERVVGLLEGAAREIQVDLSTERLDLRFGAPPHLLGRFDAVVTDPPRNFRKCRDFLRFAASCLGKYVQARIFWSDHPEWTVGYANLVAGLDQLGLQLLEVCPELQRYADAPDFLEDPASSDPSTIRYYEIVDGVSAAFGIRREWFRSLLDFTHLWSNLHVLSWGASTEGQ